MSNHKQYCIQVIQEALSAHKELLKTYNRKPEQWKEEIADVESKISGFEQKLARLQEQTSEESLAGSLL